MQRRGRYYDGQVADVTDCQYDAEQVFPLNRHISNTVIPNHIKKCMERLGYEWAADPLDRHPRRRSRSRLRIESLSGVERREVDVAALGFDYMAMAAAAQDFRDPETGAWAGPTMLITPCAGRQAPGGAKPHGEGLALCGTTPRA